MYITTINYGKKLDLMTILQEGKLKTTELLTAILTQNRDEIVSSYGSIIDDPLFKDHILNNTIFFDIKNMRTPGASNPLRHEYLVSWYMEKNTYHGISQCTLIDLNLSAAEINKDVVIARIREMYPIITVENGKPLEIFITKYEIFRPDLTP